MTFGEEDEQADNTAIDHSLNPTRSENSPVGGQLSYPPSTANASDEKLRLAITDIHKTFASTGGRQDGKSASNISSDKHTGSPSFRKDRLFPIKHFVGVDFSQTSRTITTQSTRDIQENLHSEGTNILESRRSLDWQPDRKASISTVRSEIYDEGERMRLFSDATSEKSSQSAAPAGHGANSNTNSFSSYNQMDEDSVTGLMNARFKHIITEDGHAVITGRDGETLQRCEDEPIHIPGAIQGFGLLIALEEQDDNCFVVRVVSENSQRIIGYQPQDLFRLQSFTDILSEEQVDNLLDHVDFIRDDETDPAVSGPEIFIIAVRHPISRVSQKLWCAMHINPANAGLIICEFELDDDKIYPPIPPEAEHGLQVPEDTLNSAPSTEEYAESTLPSSNLFLAVEDELRGEKGISRRQWFSFESSTFGNGAGEKVVTINLCLNHLLVSTLAGIGFSTIRD